MRVSYRHAMRLWERYQASRVVKLKHANAGRTSNRARPAKQRKKILQKVEEKYTGFGPTLAAEQLDKTRSEGWLWADYCTNSAPPPHTTTYSDRSMKSDCIPPRPDSLFG